MNGNIKDDKTHYKNGMAAFNENKHVEAIDHFEKSVELVNDVQSLFALGQCYAQVARHKEALETLEKAYDKIEMEAPCNAHITILTSIAKEEQYLARFDQALFTYDKILEVGKKFMKEVDLRILESEIDGKKDIVKMLKKAEDKKRLSEILERGKEMEKQGDYDNAIKLYKEFLRQKETAELYYRTGECYKQQNEYIKAIKAYTDCIQLRNEFIKYGDTLAAEALLQKGICLLELSELNEAEDAFKEAGRVLPFGNMLKEKIKYFKEVVAQRSKVLV